MSDTVSELKAIYQELQSLSANLESAEIANPLKALEESADGVGKAWSRSWLGYQSYVYYEGLQAPPAGASFNKEFGLTNRYASGGKSSWIQMAPEGVKAAIYKRAGDPDIAKAQGAAEHATKIFDQKRDDIASILRVQNGVHSEPFLERLLEETEKLYVVDTGEFIRRMKPNGAVISRDSRAMSQGFWIPPHISVLADVYHVQSPKYMCEALSGIVRRAFSYLERSEKIKATVGRIGTNVFIGHGRSKEWRELKDFINDRMRLPFDEFNRVPVAGIPNTVRLATMLDAAAIAFLVLTAEDETANGKLQARLNVVHEAGLFQGRLGFSKAIIMLEEGCEEFSNIEGLGQIRFPKNNIKAAFHDVELVLEREGLVEPK